ncbi:MAG: type II secretion system protein [Oligoflexia bacterium]|jgi:prepilin-type N-terminal cleavage/methylation domain-containing protein
MRASKTRGFTLLEVLIAMSIMVVAFGSILSIESSAINVTNRAKQTNTVAMLLKNALTQTELEIEGKTFGELQKEKTQTFEAPYSDYSWSWKVKEIEFPNLVPSSGNEESQNENPGAEQLGKLVTQYLSKAVREVEVSVRWKKAEKPQSVSATTYWVNLNHEFSLTE